jgi:peptidoglycan/xylan/chitin deacetylase (PgdA/CDA1 family)/glycosyltransferase involved in cell wall biosynthesis
MRISVIIPSYQRRELVLIAVQALAGQEFAESFEAIVVVDGSTDGTTTALRELRLPFPLTVLEQANQGSAAARSAGGFAARGDILLFMDDDMEADPRLLAEHDRSHRCGSEVVLGHIPLHPDSPQGLLSTWVKRWVDRRGSRLSVPGAAVRISDLVGGQISVSRKAFHAVRGFDARLTKAGSFGNEDVDFGYRLLRHGYQAVFNPNAISWQRYTVGARQFLRQWRQAGEASVKFARKHPEMAHQIFAQWANRRRFRALAVFPILVAPLRWLAIRLVERGRQGRLTEQLFFAVQGFEYCRGLRKAGGIPRPRPLRVLAYHALADTSGTGRFEPYGVRPEEFRQQVAALGRVGYRFVSADEVVNFVRGSGGLPRRPVLLTFDDCYTSVLQHALPILEEHDIPAVAFAVAGRLGCTNDWDRWPGSPQLALLDRDGLRRLSVAGVEIGAHSRTHPSLPKVSATDLADEVGGSCQELRAMGMGQVRLFAYPYGESDERVRRAVESAGCQGAFTVDPGFVRPNVDPYRIPRIEILRGDAGWRFLWKVAVAGPLLQPREGPLELVRSLWERWGRPILSRLRRRGRRTEVIHETS